MRNPILIIWLLFVTAPLTAQNEFSGHLLPRVIKNITLGERLTWTLGFEPDLFWFRKKGEVNNPVIELTILNLEQLLDYQLTGDLNLSGGYFFGVRELEEPVTNLEHRFVQQLTSTARMGKFRLRLRLRSEQRLFRENSYRAVHRLRSRLNMDFPLQGKQLDPGEPYINTTAEWLANPALAQSFRFRENRFYAGLGWRFRANTRFEHGLELRSRPTDSEGHHRRALMVRLTLTI